MGSKVPWQRQPHIMREHSDEASGVRAQGLATEGIELFTDTKLQSGREEDARRQPHGVSFVPNS